MGYEQEIWLLRRRVKELEKQVEQLRVSRRVLMNLIERMEEEKKNSVSRLEKENKKLQMDNRRYAKRLMKYNSYLVELKDEQRSLMEEL
ncbi:MAG: translation initiation factor 2 [Peptococcaceae bacterium]|jgi:conjugal transfer/entry exclusion protein|nr:translation initiation factor 2 [Peptococcaceae bacterium]MDH7524122.1 translation initiation factor 2 [Peptococcaceae bacterium]